MGKGHPDCQGAAAAGGDSAQLGRFRAGLPQRRQCGPAGAGKAASVAQRLPARSRHLPLDCSALLCAAGCIYALPQPAAGLHLLSRCLADHGSHQLAGSAHTHQHVLQGIGVVWPTNIGMLEFNWCKILRAQPDDRQRTGLHFGLALRSQFL